MFSPFVVCYLFLGGTGAGACFAMAVAGLLVPNSHIRFDPAYRKLFVPGLLAGIGALALGCVCLAFDLGRADRLLLLLASPAPTVLTVGAYALVACLVLSVALLLFWSSGGTWRIWVARVIGVAAVVASLAAMAYTGFLLQGMRAVPLWASAWLPVLFVASSLSCGIALLLLVAFLTNTLSLFRTVFRRLVAVDVAAIAIECVAAVLVVVAAGTLFGDVGIGQAAGAGDEMGSAAALAVGSGWPYAQPGMDMGSIAPIDSDMTQTQVAAAASVETLLAGPDAWVFWFGFVAAGLLVPLLFETVLFARVRRRIHVPAALPVMISLCVLVGGFALRFAIVNAGMHPVAMSIGW